MYSKYPLFQDNTIRIVFNWLENKVQVHDNAKITKRNQSRNPKKKYENECMANTDFWIYQMFFCRI